MSAQGVDERMINVHYYNYYYKCNTQCRRQQGFNNNCVQDAHRAHTHTQRNMLISLLKEERVSDLLKEMVAGVEAEL